MIQIIHPHIQYKFDVILDSKDEAFALLDRVKNYCNNNKTKGYELIDHNIFMSVNYGIKAYSLRMEVNESLYPVLNTILEKLKDEKVTRKV